MASGSIDRRAMMKKNEKTPKASAPVREVAANRLGRVVGAKAINPQKPPAGAHSRHLS
jgi:hypothetical protein